MIYFHADDYGISVEQSKLILDCCYDGVLNSVSVMPNGVNLATSVALLDGLENIKRVNIHINLVEGKCCSNPQTVPLLVDNEGYFCNSFEKILFKSIYNSEMRRQIKFELKTQIDTVYPQIKILKQHLEIGLDSHQHTHMIPAVWDALVEMLSENRYSIDFMRVPAEPIKPFLNIKAMRNIRPINIVKNILLNILWCANKKNKISYNTNVFWGIMFSGTMRCKNVIPVLDSFLQIASKKNMDLEILFHPGAVEEIDLLDKRKKEFVNFYYSDGRKEEADCLKKLKNFINNEK